MRISSTIVLSIFLLTVLACTSSTSGSSKSHFWDAEGDVVGSAYAFRYEIPSKSPAELFDEADIVIVGRVERVIDTEYIGLGGPFDGPGWEKNGQDLSEALASHPFATTFEVSVLEQLKGEDAGKIRIRNIGGLDPEGVPVGVIDGDLLLEPDRTYLLFLRKSTDEPANPQPGHYTRLQDSRGTFDLTTGKIIVMNHEISRDLGKYEGLDLDEFLVEAVGLSQEAVAAKQ